MAVIGLAGFLPVTLASVAVIAVSVALLLSAGATAARYERLAKGEEDRPLVIGGTGADMLLAVAAIVLGVLSLIGISPEVLLPVAVLGLGGALAMSGFTSRRVESFSHGILESREEKRTHEAVRTANTTEVIIGLSVLILGILALAGNSPLTLTLVAALGLGAATMLSGGAVASRVFARNR
jgi:hypothetical protein